MPGSEARESAKKSESSSCGNEALCASVENQRAWNENQPKDGREKKKSKKGKGKEGRKERQVLRVIFDASEHLKRH